MPARIAWHADTLVPAGSMWGSQSLLWAAFHFRPPGGLESPLQARLPAHAVNALLLAGSWQFQEITNSEAHLGSYRREIINGSYRDTAQRCESASAANLPMY